jgi:DNA-binding transcriptional MerR regulator
MRYKIGDFSRLSRVSVKALRYYDDMGLLKPAQVDGLTGYRYYAADQLPRLHRILALKDLGFSLDEVARLLTEGVPAAEMRGMLRLKQAEIHRRMEEEQARLARVEARLQQIENEGKLPMHEVVVKPVEAQVVASVRAVIPDHAAVKALFYEMSDYLNAHSVRPTGPPIALWHDHEFREQDVDAEAAFPIEGAPPSTERVRVHPLPRVETMVCAIRHGSFESGESVYEALFAWIAANHCRIVGANRIVILQYSPEADPETYVSEIQFPVAKV